MIHRCIAHKIADRAALLSFYFLLALFPLLIVLLNVIGFMIASETDTYIELLNYLDRIMPHSAFTLLLEWLNQLASKTSGGKVSLGVVASLWTASSGVMAIIEALNFAFEVPPARSWWHRRLIVILLTLFTRLYIGRGFGIPIGERDDCTRCPCKGTFAGPAFADVRFRSMGATLALLSASLVVVYSFGPHLKRKRWEGSFPGAVLAMGCWLLASFGLRTYLQTFTPLSDSYGSLAGVMALLFWLYVSGATLVVGGEFNAVIWHATNDRS